MNDQMGFYKRGVLYSKGVLVTQGLTRLPLTNVLLEKMLSVCQGLVLKSKLLQTINRLKEQ